MKESFPFKPLSKTRLYEEVADQIKQAIYEGRLKPGDRLPAERELCRMFNVGRPTVREALRTLSVMGLVEIHRGARGAFISEVDISQYMEAMREDLLWMIRTDGKTLQELWEVRKYVELGIAHAVVAQATPKDYRKLEQLIEKMEACGNDMDSYFPFAVEFHRELALLTRNKVFFLFWELCHSILVKSYVPMDAFFPEGPSQLLQANKALLSALKSRDLKKVESAMALHCSKENIFHFTPKKGSPRPFAARRDDVPE